MKYEVIYSVLQQIYCIVLKDELYKLANKSDSKVDNIIVGILDKVFGCESK